LSFKVLASHTRSPGEPSLGRERLSPTFALQGSIESQAAESPLPTISRRERALRVLERVVLASGIVLFFVLLARLGFDNVVTNLRMVGWGIVVIVAAEILPYLVNTLSWRTAFPPGGRVPSFGQLLLARIGGEAANYLTPTATMGGEFVRVRMLQGQAEAPSLVASVLVAKLTQALGLVAFITVGLLLLVDDARLSASARWGILGSLALLAALLTGLLIMQRRGLLAPALRLADRWPILRFLAPLRSSVERIDAEMARVHRESPGRIALSSAIFALGFAYGTIETYLILWFFGVPVTLKLALAIEVLGLVLSNLMFFVPLRAGTQEAGKALVFAMLGLDPAQGLAAGVVCRIRELTWAFIGLAILARSRLATRPLPPLPETLPSLGPTSPGDRGQNRRTA
jgi:glycosyltransferase 2 family protein